MTADYVSTRLPNQPSGDMMIWEEIDEHCYFYCVLDERSHGLVTLALQMLMVEHAHYIIRAKRSAYAEKLAGADREEYLQIMLADISAEINNLKRWITDQGVMGGEFTFMMSQFSLYDAKPAHDVTHPDTEPHHLYYSGLGGDMPIKTSASGATILPDDHAGVPAGVMYIPRPEGALGVTLVEFDSQTDNVNEDPLGVERENIMPGDRCITFTDGLKEAPGKETGRSGMLKAEGVADILNQPDVRQQSPQEMNATLMGKLEEDHEIDDDVTIYVVARDATEQ